MLTGPLFMLQVYDRVLGSRSQETLVALTLLVAMLYVLLWLLDLVRSRLLARFGGCLQSALESRVFRAAVVHSPARPEALRATRDLEIVRNFYGSPAMIAIMDVPFTPLFIGAIFVFHPSLGWLAVLGSAFLISLTAVNQVLNAKRINEAQNRSSVAYGFEENTRLASDLIQSQAMTGAITERWLRLRDIALSHTLSATDWTGCLSTFTKSFRLFLQSAILALGAWLVLASELSAGAMIASSILLGRALAPIEQLLARWPFVVEVRQCWTSLSDFLSSCPAHRTGIKLPRPSGQIDVKGITVSGGPGAPALLYNLSFSLAPGEALGIIGRSGSGKSTIARVLLQQLRPTVGEVRLGGALLSQYDPEELGTYIGYLPQETTLISGTIAENIARMALDPRSDLVVGAAKRACAHELVLSLPDGYATRVGDRTCVLSGGQKQRIALARALYGEPVLLVLDEPNSALDHEGTEALNQAIRAMKSEGKSVVIMTHRPMAISECDNLIVIESGAVRASGTRDAVLRSIMNNASNIQQSFASG